MTSGQHFIQKRDDPAAELSAYNQICTGRQQFCSSELGEASAKDQSTFRMLTLQFSCKLQTFFEKLRNDMEATCFASYFAEVLQYITRENNDESALLLLTFQSFRALESDRIPRRLVRAVFEIRTTVIEGEFLPPLQADGFSAPALQAVDHIVSSPIRTLYTFAVKDSVLLELEHIAQVSMKRSLNHDFESLEILRVLTS